tara:strand:- start:214 stop:381 length:168 start_codon:yes stop_codon:yes gene_type:complete
MKLKDFINEKDEKEDEPDYEPEDICSCREDGIEPEWAWDKEQGMWECQGCGETQN